MNSNMKENLIVEPLTSDAPEIGTWLWALQDTRQRTMRELQGLTQATIDWLPADQESSIGTVLYHMAAIEADWLYAEVLEQSFPAEVEQIFPYAIRDGQGRLLQVPGVSLEEHLRRLERVRGMVMEVIQHMTLADFRRARSLENYNVTPEWVLHHLMQHEAEHRSQIGGLKLRAARELKEREAGIGQSG